MLYFQLALAATLLCLFCTTNGWKSFEFETNERDSDYLNTKFIAPEFGLVERNLTLKLTSCASGGEGNFSDDLLRQNLAGQKLQKRGLLRSIFGFWAAPHEVWFRHKHQSEAEEDETICGKDLSSSEIEDASSDFNETFAYTPIPNVNRTTRRRLFTSPPPRSDILPDSLFKTDYRSCPKLKPRLFGARSVHDVRPDEIKAIMSIGDSIMTGFGTRLRSLSDVWSGRVSAWTEYRGTSFVMGNDSDVTTLANLFSNYNQRLIGPSGGNHSWQVCWGLICGGVWTPSIDNLNAAQSGAMVMNLEKQVTYIIRQVRKYSAIGHMSLNKDYKFLTIWAGSNDMCVGCTSISRRFVSPEKYGQTLREILERVRTKLPRTIVNIMATLRISQVYEIDKNRGDCFFSRNFILPFACPCAFVKGRLGDRLRARMDQLGEDYNRVIVDIVREYQSKQDPNFAVIFDPGMSGMSLIGTPHPPEYLSPLDCFHPSLKAHELIAKAAWNNLFRNSTSKYHFYDPLDASGSFCPNENSRIQTF